MIDRTFFTKSPAMVEVLQTAKKIASMDLNLLINGEQGTGKEWMARTIHELSGRSRKPFWTVDCDSNSSENMEKEILGREAISRDGVTINRGGFEEAQGGTLLLNHIENLEPSVQKKIARVMEYKTLRRVDGEQTVAVDVRTIVTVRKGSDDTGHVGQVVEALFSKVNLITIDLPPLRERREDIPLLIQAFIAELRSHRQSNVEDINEEALGICVRHYWPGNIRNLRNAIEYASVMCNGTVIQPHDLPDYLLGNHHKKVSSVARIP